MSDEKQSFLNKIPIYPLVTIFVVVGGMFVARYQVAELIEDQAVTEKDVTELHNDMDILKVRIVQELYEIKLEVKNEKIERLESQLEYYKNK